MTTIAQARPRKITIPATMEAAAVDKFGPPSALKLHTLPVPELGTSDVLIAVNSAGVGIWDASLRDGSWQPTGRTKFPFIPGTDGAGIVVAKGARVRRLAVGDRVYAVKFGGFYAQYVAVPAEQAAHLPKRLNFMQAGAAAVTGLTALQGIDDQLHVSRGQAVLIFGASGAVGTLAVQFAKRKGARVLGTATGRDAMALVRRLGAHAVIDARSRNAAEHLQSLAPKGIDAVLALAGGETLERCLDLVRAGGRVAFPHGVEPEPRRRPHVRLLAYDGVPGSRQFARLERAVVESHLRVPIAASYSLAEAAKAHIRLEKGHVVGRIVLQIKRGQATRRHED